MKVSQNIKSNNSSSNACETIVSRIQSQGKRKTKQKVLSANINKGAWTDKERSDFREGLRIYGRNWTKIAELIGTRTPTQVRTHNQKVNPNKNTYEEEKKRSYTYRFIEARRNIAREEIESFNDGRGEDTKNNEQIKISKELWSQIESIVPALELSREIVIYIALESLLKQLEYSPSYYEQEKEINGESIERESKMGRNYLMTKEGLDRYKSSLYE